MRPMVSICIPAFNRKHYLGQTLESVFAQTYTDYEIVIVDDGSTDGTDSFVRSLGRGIRYYWQENQGEPFARNRLVQLAKGRYVSFLDSDDLLYPDAVERMVKVAEGESDDVIVYGSYVRIDENGRECGRSKRPLRSGQITRDLFMDILVHPNGSLFPRAVLDAVGPFDTSLPVMGDYDFLLRASLRHRFIAVPAPTFKRRRHSGNISRRSLRGSQLELDVLERFYYERGGDQVVPARWAARRLSVAGYRAGRCALEEGAAGTASQLLGQSFRRHPNLKSLIWWAVAAAKTCHGSSDKPKARGRSEQTPPGRCQ